MSAPPARTVQVDRHAAIETVPEVMGHRPLVETSRHCGACGYATCAQFLYATKALRDDSSSCASPDPPTNLRSIDPAWRSARPPKPPPCTSWMGSHSRP
jgi:hypothetical protein